MTNVKYMLGVYKVETNRVLKQRLRENKKNELLIEKSDPIESKCGRGISGVNLPRAYKGIL